MNQNGNRLNKAAVVIAKIMEVCHWVAVGLMTASFIVYWIDDALLRYFIDFGDGEFGVSGYSIQVLDGNGSIIAGALLPTLIAGIIVCGLTAMIFRNIYLIFKTAAGKTKFSEGETPFQPANVRMLREIGIFSLSIPFVEWTCDGIARLIVGWGVIESSVSMTGIVFGIALLCLSQFFAYGVQLQNDSDGLL